MFSLASSSVGAASGVDWTRDAVAQDAPQTAEELQRRVDEIQRANREAAQRPTVTDSVASDRIEVTGRRADDHSAEATATTVVREGVIPAPRQKGFADLLGAAEKSAGMGRFQLKVFGESVTNNGYYVIDSLTGRVWYGTGGDRPQLLVAELPQQ